ncbi:MAG TPA: hypothetical protein VFQ61_01910, partial [Polyangiaceae bacterium]|nr:hypothetical protein [Polyangiaceae bacterium]
MLNVSKYFFALAAVVSITAVGCDDGGGTQAATGGSGGGTQTAMGGSGGGGTTSAPPTGEAIALTPNEMGWVDLTTNTVGIQGAWYPYGDNAGDKKCTATGGHTDAECSVIAKPDPTVMGFPNTG